MSSFSIKRNQGSSSSNGLLITDDLVLVIWKSFAHKSTDPQIGRTQSYYTWKPLQILGAVPTDMIVRMGKTAGSIGLRFALPKLLLANLSK